MPWNNNKVNPFPPFYMLHNLLIAPLPYLFTLFSTLFFLKADWRGSGDFEDRPPNDLSEGALEGEAETVLNLLSGAGDMELRFEPRLPMLDVEIFLAVFSTL
jgi:hypothetical protein